MSFLPNGNIGGNLTIVFGGYELFLLLILFVSYYVAMLGDKVTLPVVSWMKQDFEIRYKAEAFYVGLESPEVSVTLHNIFIFITLPMKIYAI